jgi:Na+/proline symporter
VLSAVLIFPLFLIFLLVGVLLWAFYRQHPMAIPLPESRPGIKANDFIYPIFMMTAVPHFLKGFLIVAILSAAMSSISSALTSLASVSTMDFVKVLHAGRSEGFYLRFSKYSTVGWAVVLVGIAYLTRQVEFVLNAAFSLRGLTSGALLGGLLMALFWSKGGAAPVIVGMMASLAAMIGISQLEWTQGTGESMTKAKVFWPWFTLIGTIVTLSVGWLTRAIIGAKGSASQTAS